VIILAFLQNQWFKDPEAARQVFARHPEHRERLVATYLFMGCLTGRRLLEVFGEELCDEIVWEECSPEIGGKSSSAFPADLDHIRKAIDKHRPDVILAFGKIAGDAMAAIRPLTRVIRAPHPAARQGSVWGLSVALDELNEVLRAS